MNEPITVRSFEIKVSGDGRLVIEPLLKSLSHRPYIDKVFSSDGYESAKNYLLNLCHSKGFIDASTESSTLVIDPDKKSAYITINLNTGSRYSFGPIEINQSTYSKNYLRSLAEYQSGSSYNDALISKYKNNLESSNLFNHINVLPLNLTGGDLQIPTQVFYDPIDKIQYGFGIGYSTDSNLFYNANVIRNRINDHGMRLNTEILSSSDYGLFLSTLSIPRTHPTKDYYNFQVGYTHQYIEYVGSDKNLTVTLSHILNQKYDEKKTIRIESSLNYSLDRSKFDNFSASTMHFLYPSIQYDAFFNDPKRALQFFLKNQLLANFEVLLSPCDFMKLTAEQKFTFLANKKITLVFSLSEGYIATSDSIQTLPLSWYFYTGGSYSVRGFKYQSIGSDINKYYDYNNYLYTASFETQYNLQKDFSLISFVDMGDATENIQTSQPCVAMGAGVLWKTFAGDLEISVAKPIINHSSDPSMRLRLNIILSHPFY